MLAETRVIMTGTLLGVCLLLVLNLAGCSSSTDPGVDPPLTIEFSPLGQGQELRLSETMVFSAAVSPAAVLSTNWYRSGFLVGQDSVFTYVPAEVGRDVLEVSAFAGAERDTYYWVIDVQEDVTAIPPEVPNVEVRTGPEPADVVVSWIWVTGATFPLVEYLVAVSYDGPIHENNWDQAAILESCAVVPGQLGYSRTYTEAEHGMKPGEQAWFAVRVLDDRQQLSFLTYSVRHDITWPWYLGGYVIDDAGAPLSMVTLMPGADLEKSTNTDGSGLFLFDEPFHNTDSITLTVTTNISPFCYDFETEPVSVGGQDTTLVNITLINRYDLGYDYCYGGDFLAYLRYMTWTTEVVGQPELSQLHIWDEYPVSVFIPPFQNLDGVDFEEACLAALDFWNTTINSDTDQLGIDETAYFVRTTDEAAADIVFLFELRDIVSGYGKVTLLLPDGPEDELGRVVPEKMQVWINTIDALGAFETVQGVALHEFGHTLGLRIHANCGADYLMQIAGGLGAMGRDDPIHLDERRAVRAIRNIPQGTYMNNYILWN